MYHDPHPDVFDEHLGYLASRFEFTTLDVIVDALLSDDWSTVPARALAVTIDDGHAGNHALLPIFRKHGLRPTIFLCSGIIGTGRRFWFQEKGIDAHALKGCDSERRREILRESTGFDQEREYLDSPRQALSREQILEMAPYVDFGAHTRFHPILPRCSDAEAWQEISQSRQDLEKLLDRPCRHFAYPNGDHDEREVDIVHRSGFDSARTTVPGWNGPGADPLRLRALPTTDHVDVDTLAVKLTGLGGIARSWLRRVRGGRGPSPG